MTRAPVLQFPSAMRAAAFKAWLEAPENAAAAKASFESTTRFGKLNSVRVTVAGRYAYARFACATGDAMGMNMVSKGVNAVLEWLQQGSERFPDMEVLGLSGNLCCDKKPAAVNWIEGRGKSVIAEAVLPGAICRAVLKAEPERIAEVNTYKNLVGSAMAGSIGGFNAHASNVVTALFLALGVNLALMVFGIEITKEMRSEGGVLVDVTTDQPLKMADAETPLALDSRLPDDVWMELRYISFRTSDGGFLKVRRRRVH